jgi:hypothetical protein
VVAEFLDVVSLRLRLAFMTRERDTLRARIAQLERKQEQRSLPRVFPVGWDDGADVQYRQSVP